MTVSWGRHFAGKSFVNWFVGTQFCGKLVYMEVSVNHLQCQNNFFHKAEYGLE